MAYQCNECKVWKPLTEASWAVRVHRVVHDKRGEAVRYSQTLEHYCEQCAPKDRWNLPEDCIAAHAENTGQSRDEYGDAVPRFQPVVGRCVLKQWNEWMEDHNVDVVNEHDRFLDYTHATRDLFPDDARADLDRLVKKYPRVEVEFPWLGGTNVNVHLPTGDDPDFTYSIGGRGFAEAASNMVKLVCREEETTDAK